MKVSIEYCSECDYRPKAASLAERLEKDFNAEVELVPAHGGVFEVIVDDDRMFSKRISGEFPDEDRLVADIRARMP